jgi:hypothetical protein
MYIYYNIMAQYIYIYIMPPQTHNSYICTHTSVVLRLKYAANGQTDRQTYMISHISSR